MKVLSLRPVWAWAVLHGGKTIENRTWNTDYRGPLLIHASGSTANWWDHVDYVEQASGLKVPETLECGAIIGAVDLVDVLAPGEPLPNKRARKWAEDNCLHWVFANPRACKPVDVLGKLRLWDFDGKHLKWIL